MAYVLQALVARESVIRGFVERFRSAYLVPLAEGLALVPLTERLLADLTGSDSWDMTALFGDEIPVDLARAAEDASRIGAVAYLEAEFFGGLGAQACVVWEATKIALGPIVESADEPTPLSEGAINQALRYLGVVTAAGSIDEFDTVGLGRQRSTEDRESSVRAKPVSEHDGPTEAR